MKFSFIRKTLVLAAFALLFFLNACTSNSNDAVIKAGASGYFVVNEGSFGAGNTSISFYDRKTDVMTNNIFAAKNGRPLGDQAQSMTVFDSKGYVVVQNSGKVEVINVDDFSSIGTITNLPSPRYFIGVSSTKGYVSDWGADGVTGTVKVIDLTNFTVIKTIPTGKGANKMIRLGNFVYVTNSGGYDRDNSVAVIDVNSDAVSSTITLGDNPNSIQQDKDGNLWVACSGYTAYNNDFTINTFASTKGSIHKLSAVNSELLRSNVDKITQGPANLSIAPDGSKIYYTYDGLVWSMATNSLTLPNTPLISKSYYGLTVDPFDGSIIGFNASSFTSAGTVEVYNTSGALQNTYTAGIAPSGAAFK